MVKTLPPFSHDVLTLRHSDKQRAAHLGALAALWAIGGAARPARVTARGDAADAVHALQVVALGALAALGAVRCAARPVEVAASGARSRGAASAASVDNWCVSTAGGRGRVVGGNADVVGGAHEARHLGALAALRAVHGAAGPVEVAAGSARGGGARAAVNTCTEHAIWLLVPLWQQFATPSDRTSDKRNV